VTLGGARQRIDQEGFAPRSPLRPGPKPAAGVESDLAEHYAAVNLPDAKRSPPVDHVLETILGPGARQSELAVVLAGSVSSAEHLGYAGQVVLELETIHVVAELKVRRCGQHPAQHSQIELRRGNR
jgi:hypothetical protein